MGLIDTSALEAVTRALNSTPNAAIDPKIWQEITRLHGAIKEVAALTDAVNNPPGGTIGGVPVNSYLQEQTIIPARANFSVPPGAPVLLTASGGELRANIPAYSSGSNHYVTRVDAMSLTSVASGAVGNFILRGVAVAYNVFPGGKYDSLSTSLAVNGSRVLNYSGPLRPTIRFGLSTLVGLNSGGKRIYGQSNVCGVYLNAYQVSQNSATILMYFNPVRQAGDKLLASYPYSSE